MTEPPHVTPREEEAEAFELTPRAAASRERVESALERIEALVLQDPGDDVLRANYLRLADAESQQLRAANALARAAGANEAVVRERDLVRCGHTLHAGGGASAGAQRFHAGRARRCRRAPRGWLPRAACSISRSIQAIPR